MRSSTPKEQPKVSLIVTAYNMERYLDAALQSVAEQSYRHLEVIIIDDGSTDQTQKISKKYPFRYTYQENGGMSNAKNAGIKLSTGDYLCFLDADDILLPNRVSTQARFLDNNPAIDLVFSDYQNFVDEENLGSSHFHSCPKLSELLDEQSILSPSETTRILAQENFGICGSFMIRRRALDEVPCFDERLKSGDDFHFYYRIARRSNVGVLNQVCFLRRLHDSNMSGRPDKKIPARIQSFTMLRDSEKDDVSRALLTEMVASFYREYARYGANSRNYKNAICQEIKAWLIKPTLQTTRLALKGLMRTTAIAFRIHNPDE